MLKTAATALAALALLAACGTTQYIMSTKSGEMIVTEGRPELNNETGMYEYRDAEGKRMQLNKGDVVQIIER